MAVVTKSCSSNATTIELEKTAAYPAARRYSPLLVCAGLLLRAVTQAAYAADERPEAREYASARTYAIPTGPLIESLGEFSRQSSWQVTYQRDQIATITAPALRGSFTVAQALDRLLALSNLSWSVVDQVIVVRLAQAARPPPTAPIGEARVEDEPSTALSNLNVFEDAPRAPGLHSTSSAFGFDKPLVETPRTISVIDEETISLFDLSAIEDLVRVVPGVYTTTRFGIQGSVDIRNVPADTYFRGMKRLTLQGHGRSVLAAMDSIEVVGGPASPLYGMGKIGGYTNMWPKSGRAKTGGYLSEPQGFAHAGFGDYDRAELVVGLGGPADFLQRFGKRGGYYVYGLIEDSDAFSDDVPVEQRILQIALSVDDFAGRMRLETGASYQFSATAGALTGRFTQELANHGRYIRGTPLVDLDLNDNGAIGYLEMHSASPTQGALSINNLPLLQTWAWPLDGSGRPLPLDQFPQLAGIPQSLYDYLLANPQADPSGLLRAQGAGGPQPLSGYVPIGMALDPRTIGFDTLDLRRAAAYERELQANFLTLFVDLIYDTDPTFTLKNQLFFDGMDQYKTSNQPFSTTQTVYVLEDKLTVTWRWTQAPAWLRFNTLASINYRNTVSRGQSLFGDFSSHRTDAMAASWHSNLGGMTPNTTFANGYDNPSLANDGYPWGTLYRTEFSEFGVGVLLDINLFDATSLLLGARIDGSEASNVDYAGSFNAAVGTSTNPGRYTTADARAERWDEGVSWSASLAQRLPWNLHAYATVASSSIVLDANNNALTNATIDAGHIGAASLVEIGMKASTWRDRLFIALSAYEQERTDADASDPSAIINAYAGATRTRGAELEIKLSPSRYWQLSLYGLEQRTYYEPNMGATLLVDARVLGFRDVVDGQGNVVYPAEAFLYGGRSRIALPANFNLYKEKQGNPHLQFGLNGFARLPLNFGVTFGGNYFSETCSGRLCVVTLPESYVFNAGALWRYGAWSCKLDVLNLTNERYFRARTGDTLGDVLAQAMPNRHWQFAVKKSF